MRGSKLSVNRTKKESQRDVRMVRGGSSHGMVKQQAAGPAKAGHTGTRETSAPGAKFARGGPRNVSYSSSVTATPGVTGSR